MTDTDRAWFTNALELMGEPPLTLPLDGESYRCLVMPNYLRDFGPRATRIDVRGSTAYYRYVELKPRAADGAFEPSAEASSPVLEERQGRLTARQLVELLELLQEADPWRLPALADDQGFDGDYVVLEGSCAGERFFIKRWSPDNTTAEGRLWRFFARVTMARAAVLPNPPLQPTGSAGG